MQEIEALKKDLYETAGKGKNGMDDDGVPLAIRVLCELMPKRRSDLFGPDYQGIMESSGDANIGKLLGTGSFALVFSYRMEGEAHDDASAVLKVPLLQNSVHLERELDILRILEREEGPDSTINHEIALPVVMGKKCLTVLIGGVQQPLPGYVLGPQGTPLTSCAGELQKVGKAGELERIVVQMWSQLKAVVEFIHHRKVYHNDVAPKNIIVRDAHWNVCLVDFGSAFHDYGGKSCDSNNNKMTGFVGTPSYAHMDIFQCYPGKPWKKLDPKYDMFGLSLTISALLGNEGKTCWDMSPFPAMIKDDNRKLFQETIENRKEQAIAQIEESGCSKEQKEEWVSWITTEKLPELSLQGRAASAALPGDSSHIPFQEIETDRSRHLPTLTSPRSGIKRKGKGPLNKILRALRPKMGDDDQTTPSTDSQSRALVPQTPPPKKKESPSKRKKGGKNEE